MYSRTEGLGFVDGGLGFGFGDVSAHWGDSIAAACSQLQKPQRNPRPIRVSDLHSQLLRGRTSPLLSYISR